MCGTAVLLVDVLALTHRDSLVRGYKTDSNKFWSERKSNVGEKNRREGNRTQQQEKRLTLRVPEGGPACLVPT